MSLCTCVPVRDGRSQRGSATKRLGELSFAVQISRGQNAPANSATPCDSHHPVEEPLCLYCNAVHTLENCTSLRSHPYPDRIEFLKSKGLCFALLVCPMITRQGIIQKRKLALFPTVLGDIPQLCTQALQLEVTKLTAHPLA